MDPLKEIREAWEAKEVTATELAARTGKDISTVCKTLRGKIDPPLSVVNLYLRAYQDILAERAAQSQQAPAEEGVA